MRILKLATTSRHAVYGCRPLGKITVSRTSPRLDELAQAKGSGATSELTSMPYAESNLTTEATMDIQQGVWERSSFKRAQHI